jgi:SOS-response transcriptional repressor LexA
VLGEAAGGVPVRGRRPIKQGDPLSARQTQCLQYIEAYRAERGVSPSWQEIATAMGLRSTTFVTETVRAIVAKGYLRAVKGQKRALCPVRPGNEGAGVIERLTAENARLRQVIAEAINVRAPASERAVRMAEILESV